MTEEGTFNNVNVFDYVDTIGDGVPESIEYGCDLLTRSAISSAMAIVSKILSDPQACTDIYIEHYVCSKPWAPATY